MSLRLIVLCFITLMLTFRPSQLLADPPSSTGLNMAELCDQVGEFCSTKHRISSSEKRKLLLSVRRLAKTIVNRNLILTNDSSSLRFLKLASSEMGLDFKKFSDESISGSLSRIFFQRIISPEEITQAFLQALAEEKENKPDDLDDLTFIKAQMLGFSEIDLIYPQALSVRIQKDIDFLTYQEGLSTSGRSQNSEYNWSDAAAQVLVGEWDLMDGFRDFRGGLENYKAMLDRSSATSSFDFNHFLSGLIAVYETAFSLKNLRDYFASLGPVSAGEPAAFTSAGNVYTKEELDDYLQAATDDGVDSYDSAPGCEANMQSRRSLDAAN